LSVVGGNVFVMTIDQRRSRRDDDRVEDLLKSLATAPGLVRSFERTAGDEIQGLLGSADRVVDIALHLVRDGGWNIGIGAGAVREPVPASVRAASGPAFERARTAVEQAKAASPHLCVVGSDAERSRDAEVLLRLLAEILQRRTAQGWEVADLLSKGLTQRDVATRVGISVQAVSQRARVAMWQHEPDARALAARLLEQADS
jgi:uncharacterized protein YerC